MSPEILKWFLIGTFTFLIIALIVHIVVHGVRVSKADGEKPLFRKPSKEQMMTEMKWDLIICTIFIVLIALFGRGD